MSWLRNAIAKWRRKPRYRIVEDFLDFKVVVFYLLVTFFLIYGGLGALLGFDREGNPWLGVAAFMAGCALATLGVLHVMRPKQRPDDDVSAEAEQDH